MNALAVLAGDSAIDMVVCDINMPRMDGLTLLGQLQEREDHMATIIVSAYGDMANIRTAMNRGAFDFLTKPIDFVDLEQTIDKTLRNLEITRGYQRRQQEAERARAQLSRYFSPAWRTDSPRRRMISTSAPSDETSLRCSQTLQISRRWRKVLHRA